jgi:hypothetical protein
MMAPDGSANSYYLEIDDVLCGAVVGDTAIPANAWTWVNHRDGNANSKLTVHLKAGTHTMRLIGKETGVKLDRVILTSDTTCTPTGLGDNCATPPASSDTTAPTVSLTAPANGAKVSNTINLTATASDNKAVSRVEFLVDGAVKGSDTSSPYSMSLDTKTLTNGTHQISAKAYDTSGNTKTSTVSVTVSNTGTTPPTSGAGLQATYYDSVNLTGTTKTRVDPTINFNWGAAAPITGIPTDKFSARWTGYVTPTTSGEYTFYLTGDDGVRMWIDDKQIINGWVDQSAKEYQGKVALTAGKSSSIRVEYYDNAYDASVKLAWSSASVTKQTVPSTVLSLAPKSIARIAGLSTTYYKLDNSGVYNNPVLTNTSANIDFNWGAAAPNSKTPADRFGVVWTGYITPASTGIFTFTTMSDDGIRLWVDNKRIINQWNVHALRSDSTQIALTKGKKYPIKVTYFDNYKSAVARLFWTVPGQTKPVVVQSKVLSQN